MPINLRAVQRAFDVVAYVKGKDPEHKDYGHNVAVRDPVCGKAQKLWVLSQDKADKRARAGSWVCYYCNEGGREPLALVKRMEDCNTFRALEIMTTLQKGGKLLVDLRELVMNTLYGVEDLDDTWDTRPLPKVALPPEFKTNGAASLPYFAERGIDTTKVKRYGLGYCKDGYFKNRLVVPVVLHGEHTFFVARYMKAKPPEGVKKTLYPKGATPGRVLFNYDSAKTCERVYLVEDVFSAMHLGRAAMATLGTQFSQYQLDLLLRTSAHEVVIVWDRDAIDKATKLAERLAEFYTVRVVELPDARDPDEFSRAEIAAMVAGAPVLDAGAAFRSHVAARLGT